MSASVFMSGRKTFVWIRERKKEEKEEEEYAVYIGIEWRIMTCLLYVCVQ